METNSLNTERKEAEFNLLLKIIFIGGVIRTVVNCISELINYSIFNDEYFGIFSVSIIIFSVIHIFGIIYTLLKKTLLGIWIVFGNIICSICIVFLFNEILDYEIFDANKMSLNALHLVIIPIVLLLRKDGISAWSILIKNSNYKTYNKQEKSAFSRLLLSLKSRISVLKYIDYKFMLILWAFISIITIGSFHIGHNYTQSRQINNNSYWDFIIEEDIQYEKIYVRNTGLEISIVISLSGFLVIGGWGYINNKKKRNQVL